MSNDYPGDEPTRAYRPFEEEEATRLERSVPTYDPSREPAPANPYGLEREPEEPTRNWGIAAQLVSVGLGGIIVGLILGWFLFGGLGGSDSTDEPTTTTSAPASTTSTSETTIARNSTTSTTERSTTSTTSRATTSTTARQSTTTSTSRPATTTSAPATTTTASGLEDNTN